MGAVSSNPMHRLNDFMLVLQHPNMAGIKKKENLPS